MKSEQILVQGIQIIQQSRITKKEWYLTKAIIQCQLFCKKNIYYF